MSKDGPEFGAVLTATELEGCAPAADLSRWIARGRSPDSGRGTRTGFASSWAEDLEQLASLGVRAVALTLEWADLEPTPGGLSGPAIEFRRDLLRRAAELGMTPWAVLVDGTLPGWFADDEGGFEDERARGLLWPRHIDWVGETFGDLVGGWIPQREPLLRAVRSHLLGTRPPGRRDAVKAAEAVRAAMLADGEAWRLLAGTAPVATYQTARAIVPDPEDAKARPLAAGLERLLWHPWVSAIGEGRLVVGDLPVRTVDHLRGAFDRVVVELRPAIRIDGAGRWHRHPADATPGPSGLAAWPDAMAEAAARVVDEVADRPIIITGDLGDVADDGRSRPDHQQAAMAIVDDLSLAGWWQSSPFDGYDPDRGFARRPGLMTEDRVEQPAAAKYREAATGSP
ncbi:MAG: family 1 glycosylhydrolase [Actinomycetota bacterium]